MGTVHQKNIFSRRRLLVAVSSSALLSIAVPLRAISNDNPMIPSQIIFTNHASIPGWEYLGLTYCQLHPEEALTATLSRLILEDIRSVNFEQQVRAEFEQNKIVTINGWILSRTEARYLALEFLSRR